MKRNKDLVIEQNASLTDRKYTSEKPWSCKYCYKELADYDKKNAFDVEKYLEHRLVLPKDAEFELYECNVTEEEIAAVEAEKGEKDET